MDKPVQTTFNKRRSDVLLLLSRLQEQPIATCPLKKNLKKAGLVMRRNVPADGNCLFHAVSDQLIKLKLQRIRHRQLRDLAIRQLRSHPVIVSSDVQHAVGSY